MRLRAFLFDVDGTLVDSNALHARAWERAFAQQGMAMPAHRVLPLIGMGSDKLVPALVGREMPPDVARALGEAAGREFARLAREHGIRKLPGLERLFRALRARDLRVALATSGKRPDFAVVDQTSGLDAERLADAIVTGDEAASSKPDPDIVARAIERLAVPAAACAMVGDTPYDAQAAARAGAVPVAVTAGSAHDEAALRAAGALFVFRDLADLTDRLETVLGDAA